ncbi:MAG TPA: vanadium-dependent haloperoxidase [Candidatus Dormibacteraeota bacterium]|nr:vanadium-dependent haloperoxidase [Candidatus Dormibacteraeota bacterium]
MISRRTVLRWGALALAAPALSPLLPELAAFADGTSDSVALLWNAAALQGVRDSKLGPPMVARALAIVHTCIFDAWAAYDHQAIGTRLGGALRRPARERTLANSKKAISFAAYRAAVDLFPGDRVSVFDPLMRQLGYDPANTTKDITTPAGVGNVAARAVLESRHRDGANQLGDEPGGKPGVAYSDYTGYTSTNDPMDLRPGAKFDPSAVHDPNRWQPLRYIDASGANFVQPFVGAHWQHVTPFALRSAAQLRSSTGPARYGSTAYESQARALLTISAGLTDEQKMIAEYWADGPHSELPPGHWDLFAQFVSRRDHHGTDARGIDKDVKLFFALTTAIFDASICCWDNKRAFNSVRPITAVRYLFRGQQVMAWGGPYKGTQLIKGEDWFPYQASTFPTPPFPEYSSGHSTFSAAGAEILRLYTGREKFGASVTFPAGSSKFEPGKVPARDVTLRWATFSEAAHQAGLSRRYGGIHFEQGDLDARAAGRLVAKRTWAKAQSYISGTDDNGDDGEED